MVKSIKAIFIGLFFITMFLSMGYASLTGHLTIEGSTDWNEPALIYITDVSVDSSNSASGTIAVEKIGFCIFQHDDYSLNRQSGYFSPGGSVTVQITVKNNSGVKQFFSGHTADPALGNNCQVTYTDIALGDAIEHGFSKTFFITFQNSSNRALNMNDVKSTINFAPVFDESFTENATRSIAEIFSNVLAGKGPDGQGSSITYKGQTIPPEQILQTITNNMENVDTGGYIGNVGNASQDQKDLMEAIFGENITMQFGNQVYSVSLLIKNQQIDGRGSNDMVLYITADQLTIGGGRWSQNAWRDLNIVPVYGLVYINNGNNQYTFCDHMFAGEAPVCDFGGAFGTNNVGNFNTNLWNSTEYPDLTDTSGGQITQSYITTNGELDEAYQRYVRENP